MQSNPSFLTSVRSLQHNRLLLEGPAWEATKQQQPAIPFQHLLNCRAALDWPAIYISERLKHCRVLQRPAGEELENAWEMMASPKPSFSQWLQSKSLSLHIAALLRSIDSDPASHKIT